jgi:hypothetical protein
MGTWWYTPHIGVFAKEEIAEDKIIDAAKILAGGNEVAAKVLENDSEGDSLFHDCGENTSAFADNFDNGNYDFAAYVFNPKKLSLGDINMEYHAITPAAIAAEMQKAKESEMYEILKLANNGNDIELNYGIVFCYGEVF